MAGIFHAYDIRGIYPDEINEELVYKIGLALCRLFPETKEFCVGRDARLSSPSLFDSVAKAFIDSGRDVVDIGLVSTPMAYFASGRYGFGCTVQITASHNPKEYNGLKICRENAIALSYETGIRQIEELVAGDLEISSEVKGSIRKQDVKTDYISVMSSFIDIKRPLKIVIDASSGAVGPVVKELISKIDALNADFLCVEPDGNFPYHDPNPMKDSAIDMLKSRVKEFGADIGAIFDADGDRVMFVDEKGNRIGSDIVTALIAIEILEKEPGANIAYDLRSSRVVPEIIREKGGNPIITRVGHAYIKETMRKYNAPFAGELSGHYYFKDNYFADSGVLALIKVLNIISAQDKPVSELVSEIRKYHSTGEINFRVSDPDVLLSKIEGIFRERPSARIMKLDGLTVEFDDWWFNLRKSNTEPLIRLNLEANTAKLLEEKRKELEDIIIKGS